MIMGDVGALSSRRALGAVAVLAEAGTGAADRRRRVRGRDALVILQVYYYKMTHKRIFLMAPLHHHFELKGWPETIVVIRFWIISIICAADTRSAR